MNDITWSKSSRLSPGRWKTLTVLSCSAFLTMNAKQLLGKEHVISTCIKHWKNLLARVSFRLDMFGRGTSRWMTSEIRFGQLAATSAMSKPEMGKKLIKPYLRNHTNWMHNDLPGFSGRLWQISASCFWSNCWKFGVTTWVLLIDRQVIKLSVEIISQWSK